MTVAASDLDRLRGQRPEWAPWLAVVEAMLHEAASPAWDAAVPPPPARTISPDAPLLAGATVSVAEGTVRRLLERLVRAASRHGAHRLAGLDAVLGADVNALELFSAALNQSADRLHVLASAHGVDPEALQGLIGLLPVPFLQACRHRWSRAAGEAWTGGCCPMCGSWPAFAEVRGIERSRYLRCARCGAAWCGHTLTCVFCGTRDHDQLATLVPAAGGPNAVVEACTRCSGYLKTFTRLQGCAPRAVMVEDLASVDLDLAALDLGYARPAGNGYDCAVTVVHAASGSPRWTV